MAVHVRWPLTTGVAQGRYYCIGLSIIDAQLKLFPNVSVYVEIDVSKGMKMSEKSSQQKSVR